MLHELDRADRRGFWWDGRIDDKLIIAVGSSTNTHGVPGLEHCFQLKVRFSEGNRNVVI